MESLRRRNAALGRLSYGERASYIEPDMTSLGFIKLEIPTAVPEPPIGEGWIHEIKYDGYRTLIVIDQGKVRAYLPPRQGLDRTLSPGRRCRRQAALQGGADRRRDDRPGRERHLRLRCPPIGHPHGAAPPRVLCLRSPAPRWPGSAEKPL